MDWKDAECLNVDTELFFGTGNYQIAEARKYCLGTKDKNGDYVDKPCKIREMCLKYATFDHPQLFGVWGGLSVDQRKALRNRGSKPTSKPGRNKKMVSPCTRFTNHLKILASK